MVWRKAGRSTTPSSSVPMGRSRRHKMLDLIGDFALLGAYPQCEVVAIKSGHKLHCMAVRELRPLGGESTAATAVANP